MTKFKRKLNKLKRSPVKFMGDAITNKMKFFRKIDGRVSNYQYVVVSAVYNVEKYLNDYFNSLLAQTISFRNSIKVILVDDGSTDGSAKIIKKWVRKYPNNIHYIYKENGGQASARNLGLQYAKGDFVTFIDPDDTLNKKYFEYIDAALGKYYGDNVGYIAGKLIMYIEANYKFTAHPLNNKFGEFSEIISIEDKRNLQLSSASAFFRLDDIIGNKCYFPENVKPGFEDAYFINSLVNRLKKEKVILVPEAEYFYRRRSDGSSTVDKTWESEDKYSTVFKNGYIKLLKDAKGSDGLIPKYLQRLVMYDVAWYIKRFSFTPRNFHLLDETKKTSLKKNLNTLFDLIDIDVIEEFNISGFWYFYTAGTLSYFKKTVPSQIKIYANNVDRIKKMISLSFFDSGKGVVSIKINGNDIIPFYKKKRKYSFLGDVFIYEYILWIPYCSDKDRITAEVNREIIDIVVKVSGFSKTSFMINDLDYFCNGQKWVHKNKNTNGSWLFFDRDIHADDNSEHFYRYVKNNHPDQKIYFALDSTSRDWKRLAKDGFNLVDIKSVDYENKLKQCSILIGSHNYNNFVKQFGSDILLGKKFVFLQHGVTHNNVSSALNNINIDCLITASPEEFDAIAGDDSEFKYTKKEVYYTGFARFDSLMTGRRSKDCIAIMPTWRENIVGGFIGKGLKRSINKSFSNELYCKMWSSVFNDVSLKQIANNHSLEIVFIPHPEIKPYISELKIPSHINIIDQEQLSVQDVFKKCAVMITDYSSVAFDIAYLNKPIIYFQFDREEFYSQHYIKGYFDYDSHGFGPVATSKELVVQYLREIINNKCLLSPEFSKRINKFFPTRDTDNCKRIYEVVNSVNSNSLDDSVFWNNGILEEYADQAALGLDWRLADLRYSMLYSRYKNKPSGILYKIKLCECKRNTGYLLSAKYLIEELSNEQALFSKFERALFLRENAFYYSGIDNYLESIIYWQRFFESYSEYSSTCDEFDYLSCLLKLNYREELDRRINTLLSNSHSKSFNNVLIALNYLNKGDFESAITILYDILNSTKDCSVQQCSVNRIYPELLLVDVLNNYSAYSDAFPILESCSPLIKSCHIWRKRLAYTQFLSGQYAKAINQMKSAFPEGLISMPFAMLSVYIDSLISSSSTEARESIVEAKHYYPDSKYLIYQQACLDMKEKQFKYAVDGFKQIINLNANVRFNLSKCLREIGDIEYALKVLVSKDPATPTCFEELLLMADLAQLNGDFQLAKKCWKSILQYHSEEAPSWAWSRYQNVTMLSYLDNRVA